MRICLYTATALPLVGGQEIVVDALGRHLVNQGHDVVLLAPRPTKTANFKSFDASRPYYVQRHPRFVSMRHLLSYYGGFLKRLYRQMHLDIVHAHEIYPTGYIANQCRPQNACPLVITSHGGDVHTDNRHFGEPKLLARYRETVASADSLIAISAFTRNGFRQLGAPDDTRIVEIPNGVELLEFATPAPRPDDLDKSIQPGNYFLFLGRLDQRKGVDVLLKALSLIPCEQRLPVVIGGDGPERRRLEQEARTLQLVQNLHWPGFIRGDTRVYLTQNSRCLIAPSRQWEAFGLIVIESFAAGRPVITSCLPGMADLVEPGKTGDLVRPDSPDELAQLMRCAIADPARCNRLGHNARQAAKIYDWHNITKCHVDLYDRLLIL